MADYQYLIIGGGMTADAAATGIREVDPVGTIGMISADRHRPHLRCLCFSGPCLAQRGRLPQRSGPADQLH